jgi:hypothetical protein
MTRLLLVALCSMPLLSAGRADEGTMKSGDSMQPANPVKPADDTSERASSMNPDSDKASGEKANVAQKNDAKTSDAMHHGGSIQQVGEMDEGQAH